MAEAALTALSSFGKTARVQNETNEHDRDREAHDRSRSTLKNEKPTENDTRRRKAHGDAPHKRKARRPRTIATETEKHSRKEAHDERPTTRST